MDRRNRTVREDYTIQRHETGKYKKKLRDIEKKMRRSITI